MLKFCLETWNKNRELLKKHLESLTQKELQDLCYHDLVIDVVKYIYNDGDTVDIGDNFNPDKITEVDNGSYQGTLLYLIPYNRYQPSEYDYLMTYVGYGSCSGCDTLKSIISDVYDYSASEDSLVSDKAVKYLMTLCQDLVTNTIKPYNTGWRNTEMFEPVEY